MNCYFINQFLTYKMYELNNTDGALVTGQTNGCNFYRTRNFFIQC